MGIFSKKDEGDASTDEGKATDEGGSTGSADGSKQSDDTAAIPANARHSEGEDRPAERDEHSTDDRDDDAMISGGPVTKRGTFYTVKKTVQEFLDDECTDLAAALTYYSVLAIFPALLAMVSMLGVVGEAESSVRQALNILEPLVSASTLDTVEPTLRGLAENKGASLTLLLGLLGALWSASAYVGAFGRAMNRILEVEEGRPFWKLRPMNLLVTLVTLLLCCLGLLIMVVSGPVAKSIGGELGLADQSVRIWEIAKWPVLALIVVMAVGVLYRYTPNVKNKFRVMTIGAFVAIVVWLLASAGFAFYVGNFGNYNKTYGAVAGVVVGLLWLWLTNLALLFGAELDSEIKRTRQLHDGLPAEAQLQLETRDDKGVAKKQKRIDKDVEAGRVVRQSHRGLGEHGDRPFAGKR